MPFTIRPHRSQPFLYLLILTLCACTHSGRYTSKDLSALPCEEHANDFFFPLEFDEDGKYVYPDQPRSIALALQETTQVYVFVHGWNKVPMSAETDYQDLICRFSTHSKGGAKRTKAMIVGVFWPSADFPPWLDFWRVKHRADHLAITGFQDMWGLFETASIQSKRPYNIVLIGHSFGGRILLNGLTRYLTTSNAKKYKFFSHLNQLQVILLNAASTEAPLVPGIWAREPFDKFSDRWDANYFMEHMRTKYGSELTTNEVLIDVNDFALVWWPTVVELSAITDLRIYNVFSSNDGANRYLYPFGAYTEFRELHCAIGGCGVSHWDHSAKVDANGSLKVLPALDESNVWNIDASNVIFSHTDIYKGRVANLLWEVITIPPIRHLDNPEDKNEGAKDKPLSSYNYFTILAEQNAASMRNANKIRKLGTTAKGIAREFSGVGFGVQEGIRSGDWKAAEIGIRRMLKLNYSDPGWQVHFYSGGLKKWIIFNRSWTSWEAYNVSEGWLHYLLALVLAKQNRCAESREEMQLWAKATFSENYIKVLREMLPPIRVSLCG